jgi:MFS family permease
VDAPRPEPPARGTLWAVASGSFGTALAQSSVVAAGPVLAARFGVGPSSSGWIAAAYSVTVAAFVLAGGRAGDAMGLRATYRAGLALFALGAALGAASPTLCLVVAARALQGTGAALLMGTSPALVIAGLPPERRGRATGVQLALTYAGLAAGPFVGTLLARASVPALLALPLAPLVLPGVTLGARGPDAAPSTRRPSTRAMALTASAVAALVLAARFAAQRAWIAAGLGALVSAGAAVALRSRARELLPSLSQDVVRGTVGVLLVHLATAAVSASLPFALRDRKATEVAAILSVQPLAMAIAALAAGPLVDRIGARPLLRAGAGSARSPRSASAPREVRGSPWPWRHSAREPGPSSLRIRCPCSPRPRRRSGGAQEACSRRRATPGSRAACSWARSRRRGARSPRLRSPAPPRSPSRR